MGDTMREPCSGVYAGWTPALDERAPQPDPLPGCEDVCEDCRYRRAVADECGLTWECDETDCEHIASEYDATPIQTTAP
jgi:hypothetical protein